MTAAVLDALSIQSITDRDLVADTVGGSEAGFEEIVRRYQKPISSYVYRILGNHEASLDVTQEVFIKVYNSLHRYSPEFKFSTWVYRIAHNAAIDHLRRNWLNVQSLETENADGTYQIQIEATGHSPEKNRELSEWRTVISNVVQLLPDAYRQLILLRHSNDLSYDEIAEVTGLPLGTVKNRLFRAREMMRNILIEQGFDGI